MTNNERHHMRFNGRYVTYEDFRKRGYSKMAWAAIPLNLIVKRGRRKYVAEETLARYGDIFRRVP